MLRSFGDPPVFGEASGDGPPRVVALHGWGRGRHDFDAALAGLDGLSLDLPGFGMTAPPEEPWGTERYAARVVEVLDEVVGAGGEPVVLLGHSFGGRVGVRVAASRPDLVATLVLTGAPVAPSGRPRATPALGYRLLRRAAGLGLVSDDRLEAARVRYGSADYAAATGVMRAVLTRTLSEDYADDLAAITAPVVVVHGEQDAEVPLVVAETTVERVRDGRLVTVPGAGHGLPWQQPDVLRDVLVEVTA